MAPKSMRSLVTVSRLSPDSAPSSELIGNPQLQSIFLFMTAISSALGQAFLPLSGTYLTSLSIGVESSKS